MKSYLATNRASGSYEVIHATTNRQAWDKLKRLLGAEGKSGLHSWTIACLSGTGVNIRNLAS